MQALIPERARELAGTGDVAPVVAQLRDEWEGLKQKWPDLSPLPPSNSSRSPDPPSGVLPD
jgi:hypothetical protein